MNHPSSSHQEGVVYVPFGSFQKPAQVPPPQSSNAIQQMRHSYQDRIKNEVTSSFVVKPMNPRPSFPQQAHKVPISSQGQRQEMTLLQRHTQRDMAMNTNMNPRHLHSVTPSSYDEKNQIHCNTFKSCGDENFVYIHRHNSFIDVSKMTYRDHSNGSSNPGAVQDSRSSDEVDAAMTLATGLQS